MSDEDSTETPLFNTAIEPKAPVVYSGEPEDTAPEDDGTVQMHLAAPWRFSSFNTPLLPGVTLTPEWQSYDRETAEVLYNEARRCAFTVSSSVDFSVEGGK